MLLEALIVLTLIGGVVVAIVPILRAIDARDNAGEAEMVRLRFPRDLTVDQVQAFVRQLPGLPRVGGLRAQPTVVLEVVGTSAVIEHRLHASRRWMSELSRQLRVAIPGVAIEQVDEPAPARPVRRAVELRLDGHRHILRADQPASVSAAVLAAVEAGTNERVVLQWVLSPAVPQALPVSGTDVPYITSPIRWINLRPGPATRARERERVRQARAKFDQPLLWGTLRLGADAGSDERAIQLLCRVQAVLRSVRSPGARFQRRVLPSSIVADRLRRGSAALAATPILLNTDEVTALIGWPIGGPTLRSLTYVTSRPLPPAREVPTSGVIIGDATAVTGVRPVALPLEPAAHTLLIGPTGRGKSTMAAHIVRQVIAAGHGLVLLDAKGPDLVDTVADHSFGGREDEVIVVDPADDSVVGVNLLADLAQTPEVVADRFVRALTGVSGSNGLGPRSSDIAYNALLTLAYQPGGATIVDLAMLLSRSTYRRQLVGRISDPIVLEPFWAWFEQMSDAERAHVLAPLGNKLRPFLRGSLRALVGQVTPALDLGRVLRAQRVLLISLPTGLIGTETANLIGGLILGQVWSQLQTIAAGTSRRPPITLILDEFQRFVTGFADLEDVLATARGAGVRLVLAHQHTSQLTTDLRQAVFHNTHHKIVFGTGADDARLLAAQLGPLVRPEDVQGLGAYEAIAAISRGAQPLSPVTVRTRPLETPTGRAESIRRSSRQRYGRARADIDADIAARYDERSVRSGVRRERRQP